MGLRTRFLTLTTVAALTVAIPVLGLATAAQAHNYLVDSTPKAGQVLTSLPREFTITTNDVLLDVGGNGAGFALQVQDAAGRYYGDGCVTIDGPAMSTGAALGAAGTYTVTWQVISTDGHPVSDSYTFTWQPPAGTTPSAGSTRVPDCHGTLSPNAAKTPGASDRAASVDRGT
ncbi:MAG TPA: copper resistance CopC family protein, partial [Lacisediminihabitans sp.]|uniref:copper resistance CopC family protein n=1 Tax=Lacisediminihabitans sp. TaxID=2787631 RepID=UPI002ED7F3B4